MENRGNISTPQIFIIQGYMELMIRKFTFLRENVPDENLN